MVWIMKPNDLAAVTVFAEVVRAKSFRAAADALSLPRSTVSAKVAQLEARLGVRLLERTTRSLRLTHAGSAYYRSVVPALDAIEAAERAVDDLKAQPSGPLRITTTFEGGQVTLGPVIAEYMRRYPKVEVQVELTDRRVDLVEEGFDLAIRMGNLPDSTLVAKKLGAGNGMRIYASPDYLKKRKEPKRPRELETHDCLVMTGQSEARIWTFHVKKKPVRVTVRARASANSFVLLRELAVEGHGIARLPDNIAAPAVARGALRQILEAFLPPPLPWHVVYPSARYLSPKLRGFVELLGEPH